MDDIIILVGSCKLINNEFEVAGVIWWVTHWTSEQTCRKPVLERSQNPKEGRDTIEHFIQHFKDLGK